MLRNRAANVLQAAVRLRLSQKRSEGIDVESLTDALLPPNGDTHVPGEPAPATPEPARLSFLGGARSDAAAYFEILKGSYVNVLLVAVPFAFVSEFLEWGATPTFILNFVALIPLALLLGNITEDLALRFGQTIGGLINATFGNVVELILSIAALQKGLFVVVATSLLGSILGNLLLVLGLCFLAGGIKYKTQSFNDVANRASSALLFLACIGLIVPTASSTLISSDIMTDEDLLKISRATAVILLLLYVCYLVFQLHTHNTMFAGDEEESEEPILSLASAFLGLAFVTIIVACCSEYLTGALEVFSKQTGMPEAFLGMIVLPIAGNAAEHITAVMVAMKNKMDLSLGVAVGSSIQIAIFAIPFVVLVAWGMGKPFSLVFDPFAVLALTVSVILTNFVTSDATSHWLLGVCLLATYMLIAITFLYR